MIGVDLISIGRIESLYKKFGQRGLSRFLSPKEIELSNFKPQTLAGFWAAKEAISKALKTGIGKDLSFLDIKIKKDAHNAPYFKLSKTASKKFEIKESSLSITHDNGFAIAVAYIKLKREKSV